MVLFKINGERNTGTNFLQYILQLNGLPVYVHKIEDNICRHWKHGIPHADVKDIDDRVIDIFIFRKLDSWLISMSHNPYVLMPSDNFKEFLTVKQSIQPVRLIDYETHRQINESDTNKTIFEIRYYKFNKIEEYKKNNNDIIYVQLEFLQNEDNLLQFLKVLNNTYTHLDIDNYCTTVPHTKLKRPNVKTRGCDITTANIKYAITTTDAISTSDAITRPGDNIPRDIHIKNREYDISINNYRDIINIARDDAIEDFIDNLTFIIK